MMKTLIIPCAGGEKIDGLPLITVRHPKDGIILAKKVLSGIFPETYDRLVYAVADDDERRFSVSGAIRENVPSAEVVVLAGKTSGAADTVYRTIMQAGIAGEIAVKDSHSCISLSEPLTGNAIAGLDLMHSDCEAGNLRNKSFIVLNEQGNGCDIAEKHLRSDVISAGFYCFRDAGDFVSAFIRLSDKAYGAGRLYVSYVMSYLIGRRDFVFHCGKVKTFEAWSDPEVWRKLRSGSLGLADSSLKLIMADLDGTLFDTAIVNGLAYQEAMRIYGYDMDCGYFCKSCNGRHYRDFLPEIALGIGEDEMTSIHDMKKALYKKHVARARLNTSLMRLLDICRGECRIALVTTASRENMNDILCAFGLENYFDLVITQEDTARLKPDPEGYIKAMEFFGASPEECIIFEDSDAGIEAAKRSGARYFRVGGSFPA